MPSKIETLAALSRDTARRIVSSPEEWQAFLRAAARMYKYPFEEQLLIYAQRPDATACARIEQWNNSVYRRWVRPGAKGVALIDDTGSNPRLKYVFDVADTRKTQHSRPLRLWAYRPKQSDTVLEELENHFGEASAAGDFHTRLRGVIGNAVEDNAPDYVDALVAVKDSGQLSNMDEVTMTALLQMAVSTSVEYVTLTRLGLPTGHITEDDWLAVSLFDTLPTASQLGAAVSDISEMVLRQIERSVKSIEKTTEKERGTFAIPTPVMENEIDKELEQEIERSARYGNHIQARIGLSHSQPDAGEPAGGDAGQIRAAAEEIFEGASPGDLRGAAAGGDAASAPLGNRPNGPGAGRTDHDADGEGRGRDGSPEGQRPNGVGGPDEQHQAPGRGNGAARPDIQLISEQSIEAESAQLPAFSMQAAPLPTVQEQASFLQRETGPAHLLQVSQQAIDEVLCSAGNEENANIRVCAYVQSGKTDEEIAGFLKEEYGKAGGFGLHVSDGAVVSAWWDAEGVRIAQGKRARYKDDCFITWEQAAKRTRELLELGRFLSEADLSRVNENERLELAEKLIYLDRDIEDGHLLDARLFQRGFPEDAERVAEQLKAPEQRQLFIDAVNVLSEQYAQDRSVLRFRHNDMGRIVERLRGLDSDANLFRADAPIELKDASYFITEDEIDRMLTGGGNVEHGNYRIYQYFTQPHSAAEKQAFLKNEYGIGGGGYKGYDEWHDSKGITFSRGRAMKPYEKLLIKWPQAAKRIDELIALDRYLTPEQKAHLPEYERQQAERAQRFAEEQANSRVMREAERRMEDALQSAKYAYSLGDTAALGADRVTVLGYDDNTVTLTDPKYPLLSQEMPRDVFERRLRESKDNDHLIVREEQPVSKTATLYPGDKTGLPYDIVIQPLHIEEPQRNQPDISHAWEPIGGGETARVRIDFPPLQPQVKGVNYRITDDDLGHGGPKVKYQMNTAAIRTLQTIEAEARAATPDEQEILSQYVGWGGVPDAFDENKENWASEYAELKGLLTEEEYAAARASTLNAHYTSPTVIRAIYEAVGKMGFTTGNILEPACGVGNFFGLLPERMADSKLYGVELDPITGRIAKQLYPDADIQIKGFEETNHPDSFFDLAIGNVPFGNYKLSDKRYDNQNLLIHDYFFAKTLDKVRPGGVVAFITSKGTLDKQDPSVRKYLAARAELLGAIRLPNNAFLSNAGTSVVSDILFLQKRDRPAIGEPAWVHLGQSAEGYTINQYFADNPHMVLGRLTEESTQYGRMEYTVAPIPGAELSEQLNEAISHIGGSFQEQEHDFDEPAEETEWLPADPAIPNYSFGISGGKLYYRIDSQMKPADASITAQGRIRGMIGLRECTRRLIEHQMDNAPDEIIQREQARLNALYDRFSAQYGPLTNRGNSMAFSDDTAYPLLCSLEVTDDNGNFLRKADMFHKRTIRAQAPVAHVDTAEEALAVSIGERARVDLPYMSELSGMSEEQLIEKLRGVIFLNVGSAASQDKTYVTADEYLSGDVREKLRLAKAAQAAMPDGRYDVNVEALTAAQPVDLQAGDIDVRLGTTWIPAEVVQQFIHELLHTPRYRQGKIKTLFSEATAIWNVTGKSEDYDNVAANVTYGTKRINAYKIIEETLNLRDVRIFDTKLNAEGNEIRVLNKQDTIIAQQKQQAIRDAFVDWIWKEPARRERLVKLYNEKFNSIRPREYDGSHLQFHGMNPEIELRQHQKNAVARIIYGGNSLLGHVVGSGKTYTMAAAAMELRRLGLCHKPMFVVPNHLTEQWSSEFLQLYPAANILVTTKKDFERHNRQRFCSRIATGEYDAVVIGHSQFEKIPVSLTRQRAHMQDQIDNVLLGIQEAKDKNAERFTIKQMERVRKSLEVKLKKLNDTAKKDSVITFEELGVDRLFVDEAHSFKNLAAFSKMRNVAGISQAEAQKSSDMFMKCRYLDELTGNRGVIFATGTPLSNTMVEMYTMQRYLQYDELTRRGLAHFDAWASTFGETITAMELAPEGTGFRLKTRFARFFNLPELTAMFREVADIQTADMLKLPVPEAVYHTEVLKPSEFQRELLKSMAERAEQVRRGAVEPHIDNMLRITNDGRKLALDQRLIDPMLPDAGHGKSDACADNVFRIWQNSREKKLAQLVFSDLSTPKADTFNVYYDMRDKLIEKGVPPEEIAFIHDANSDAQKAALFARVRSGQVRVLLGSTAKMGAGTNVQKLLIAEHHLDVPWRPADIEQREGRIIRQGNENENVDIYRYVTENTFDAYMWATIEAKQRFISQIMTSKSPSRSCEDIDEQALSYAEVKALAAGDPRIKERMDLEVEVSKLKLLKASHANQQYELQNRLLRVPLEIKQYEKIKEDCTVDLALYTQHKSEDFPGMVICGQHCAEKKEAGAALLSACKAKTDPAPTEIGAYMGFQMLLAYKDMRFAVTLKGVGRYTAELGDDIYGNIQRMDNLLSSLDKRLAAADEAICETRQQYEALKAEAGRPFPQEAELKEKSERLAGLDAALSLGGREDAVLDAEPEIVERPERERLEMVR